MTKSRTQLPVWQELVAHHQQISNSHMRDWFASEPNRFDQYSIKSGNILLDFTRNRINMETISLLVELAEQCGLKARIAELFEGREVNTTEQRPALHPYLREPGDAGIHINDNNISDLIHQTQKQMYDFADTLQSGCWTGATGKKIKNIINIGIGGSQIGPMMAVNALKDYAVHDFRFYFLSTVDPAHTQDVLEEINADESLFIISSKSFSTIETITNAKAVITWLQSQLDINDIHKHLVAVTANLDKATKFGIPPENIFPIWDWVGGRYSIWSAIGLPILLMIGKQHFQEFLSGAHEMDLHFKQTDFFHNLPVLLALIGIWNTNFLQISAQAVIPYSHRLRYLVDYLQQAEMESNGKSTTTSGQSASYLTAPIIFGQEGCTGQHSYHQLLHQGRQLIAADFILTAKPEKKYSQSQHDLLIASALSQAHALMHGVTSNEIRQQLLSSNFSGNIDLLSMHHAIEGNKPCNILLLDALSPKSLGALLAAYEHKIFVQSVIWDINPFDQWGVELGKKTLPGIMDQMQRGDCTNKLDSATTQLINYFNQIKG